MSRCQVLEGDCMDVLPTLPTESVHCVMTSPPFWGLRDYQVAGQLGVESTPEEYVEKLVAVFREVRRVLRSDGTAWLNLGDSYNPDHAQKRSKEWKGIGPSGNSGLHAKVGGSRARDSRGPAQGLKPKDLVGVPWRVAFALQAPQHYGPIAKETDRAWLAALIDGEGTIGVKRDRGRSNGGTGECQAGYSVYLSIGNQDRELLDRCVAITGYGSVRLKDRPSVDGRGIKSRREYHGWWISSNQAVAVLRDIFPYLIAKRRQAVLAYNLDLSNKMGKQLRGNGPLPASEQQKRELLKSLCNTCNQREAVDLPSWLVEPPSNLEQGWWLRSAIVWAKPNPMPESVTDRPTSSYEMVFLLAKSERYYYDADAIREAQSAASVARYEYGFNKVGKGIQDNGASHTKGNGPDGGMIDVNPAGRNRRNVWTIATKPFPLAHFATFPEDLVTPCVLAGTSEQGCCVECGAPRERQTEHGAVTSTGGSKTGARATNLDVVSPKGQTPDNAYNTGVFVAREKITTGWQPSCSCTATAKPCTVLDPFAGAGTVGVVCSKLGRDFIGIELNPEYAAMARRRIAGAPLSLFSAGVV